MPLVLDSGGVSFLAAESTKARFMISRLKRDGLWPPRVPTAVLVECLTGHAGRDATTNRMLRTCDVEPAPTESLARRAAWLRTQARAGSAVDAIVVAAAEPGGLVLTSDVGDLGALAGHSSAVTVVGV